MRHGSLTEYRNENQEIDLLPFKATSIIVENVKIICSCCMFRQWSFRKISMDAKKLTCLDLYHQITEPVHPQDTQWSLSLLSRDQLLHCQTDQQVSRPDWYF